MKYAAKLTILSIIALLAFAVIGSKSTNSKAYAIPGSSGSLCSNKGSGLCLKLDNGSITTQPFSNANGEFVTKTDLAICNNSDKVVTSPTGCPFANGSGFNTTYKGFTIVFLTIGSKCIGTNSNAFVVPVSCPTDEGGQGGQGYVWVEDGTNSLVNRYITDQIANGSYLCSQGASGDKAAAVPFVEGACQWDFKN